MSADPSVQQLQTFIKAKRPLGIGYALPADGVMTPQFIEVLQYLQSALSGTGKKVQLISGKSPAPNALQSLIALDAPVEKPVETKPKSQEKKPSEEILDEEEPGIRSIKDLKNPKQLDDKNAQWESFLSESLPVVGKLYNGDLGKAAQSLEAMIGKEIEKPMTGVIWNDVNKSFNTTTEDIRSALSKIQAHRETAKKQANFKQDERIVRMSQMLQKWDEEK